MLNTHESSGDQVHRRQMRKTSIRTLERWLSKRQVDTTEMEEKVARRRPQSLPIGTESSLLSKLANDFNDGFTKKRLRSQYWTLRDQSRLTSFAVSAETNVILIASYGESEETLRLYRYDSLKNKLKHFQSIAVPGEPILACELLGSEFRSLIKAKHRNAETEHDQLILTGHRDGVVNLISTSLEKGHAKIIKRFNHARYLASLHENSNGARDEKGKKRDMRIRQLKLWSNVDKKQFGFVSLVDNHILVYDFGNSRTPIYQRNCPGIEAVDLNPQNMLLLAIAGSQWGNNGIALLDFTRGENSGCLFVPENSSEGKAGDKKSKHCLWLDSNTLVNAAGNVMRIWDIRYSDGEKCEIIGHPGRINAMTYHNKTNTLYSSDDHGYVITWDLSHVVTSKNGLDQIRKLTLCQSFQALLSLTEEDCSSTVQCGNVIVSPDIQRLSPKEQRRMVNLVAECDEVNRLKCLKDGALASLDSVELGIHELKESVCYLSPSRQELLLGKDKTAKSADAVPTSADESDSTVNSDTTLVDSNHSINPVEAKVGHKLTHTGKGLSPILSDYESLQQHLDKELHDNFLAGDDVRSVSGGTVINLGRSIKE